MNKTSVCEEIWTTDADSREEAWDSHNLWSYLCCIWTILCTFLFHCSACKLSVHNQKRDLNGRETD